MKDVYNPDRKDILEWVNSKSEKWPASDWDDYVMRGKHDNDLLIYRLADDDTCSCRKFFIHALYCFVGYYFYEIRRMQNKILTSHLKDRRKRIDRLLDNIENNEKSSVELNRWSDEVTALLNGGLSFELNYWIHHLYHEDIENNDGTRKVV